MPYRGDIPQKDLELEAWSANLSSLITATPTLYGLTAPQATALASLVSDFATRLASATNPLTRTKVTITAKDTSKIALTAKCRELARLIKATASVTPAQRAELGLHVPDREPTPVPPPATCPVVSVERVGGMQGLLQIRDILTPSSRAKPDGVAAAWLYLKVDGAPPAAPEDCVFIGAATRNSHVINFPPGSAGKTFYLMSRWVNTRQQMGPPAAWSAE